MTKKVLVVDDEQEIVEMMKRKFIRNGFAVETALNGVEALECVNNNDFDLIITDVVMPVMDGFTFFEKLKSEKSTADIPVIVLTARSSMEGSFRALGVDDFLAKPFSSEQLIQKVDSVYSRTHVETSRGKAVIFTPEPQLMTDLKHVLDCDQRDATGISTSADLIQECSTERPNILLIDIFTHDVSVDQNIRFLLAHDHLKHIHVFVIADEQYKPAEMTTEQFKDLKNQCMIAGAKKCITDSAPLHIIQSLQSYWVS